MFLQRRHNHISLARKQFDKRVNMFSESLNPSQHTACPPICSLYKTVRHYLCLSLTAGSLNESCYDYPYSFSHIHTVTMVWKCKWPRIQLINVFIYTVNHGKCKNLELEMSITTEEEVIKSVIHFNYESRQFHWRKKKFTEHLWILVELIKLFEKTNWPGQKWRLTWYFVASDWMKSCLLHVSITSTDVQ